nr:macro domain-containing protein [Lachnoanaerobaculum umeaense]
MNTANPRPTYGGGTDTAIYTAAGTEELLVGCSKIGNIERGEVAVTPAFRLHAKYIIHTVGPKWIDGNSDEFDILERCYL